MRLLNVNTLTFQEFFDKELPPYSILSHRWVGDEISYKDFRKGRRPESAGCRKVQRFCSFIRERRKSVFGPKTETIKISSDETKSIALELPGEEGEAIQWVWVDSICIDKSSSAELSEAINSMFSWYANAKECFVYMQDVPSRAQTSALQFWRAFDNSEWFKRGWTLQELLAPAAVFFCSSQWEVLGELQMAKGMSMHFVDATSLQAFGWSLNDRISQITGIQLQYLNGAEPIESATVARRMSWAAQRKTTRVEDEAYCLLGLFGVNMPLLYGEGSKAFLRLQEEIIKQSDDLSIFAWNLGSPHDASTGILAPGTYCFEGCRDVVPASWQPKNPFAITNLGLELSVPAQSLSTEQFDRDCDIRVVELNCVKRTFGTMRPIEILLIQCNHSYSRVQRSRLNEKRCHRFETHSLCVGRQDIQEHKIYVKLPSQSWKQCNRCLAAEWELMFGFTASPGYISDLEVRMLPNPAFPLNLSSHS